jgi:multiple sugar transport system permease protein
MFIQQYSADYNLLMAASVCSLIPVIILFLSMQNFFIEGIATTGLKG